MRTILDNLWQIQKWQIIETLRISGDQNLTCAAGARPGISVKQSSSYHLQPASTPPPICSLDLLAGHLRVHDTLLKRPINGSPPPVRPVGRREEDVSVPTLELILVRRHVTWAPPGRPTARVPVGAPIMHDQLLHIHWVQRVECLDRPCWILLGDEAGCSLVGAERNNV